MNKTLLLFYILILYFTPSVAQKTIIIQDQKKNHILCASPEANAAAAILKENIDKIFKNKMVIDHSYKVSSPCIQLEIDENLEFNSFEISSSQKVIFLKAASSKLLRYAVYTLLEQWGFRKFTANAVYVPENSLFTFPQNFQKTYTPSFDYRALFYPDCYDEDFRDWHKLDWHITDFSLWGHSFDKIISPKKYFKSHPEYFAFYDNTYHPESFCMTNETVYKIATASIQKIITEQPSRYISISQNDDVIYCECDNCKKLNEKYGGPQGSLYYFINKIAEKFPTSKIVTLAYLHTYKPPVGLRIKPNVFTLFCPIEENRGKSFEAQNNPNFIKTLHDWKSITNQLLVWDYTVQFSNYMSPFPNVHTFSDNYKLLQQNKVKGIFAQGSADVLGDFSELRQYLIAKILWDTSINVDETIDDFLRGYYGKAAPFVRKYLDELTNNQLKNNSFLDIYSGPVQCRNTFLTTENMDTYDKILRNAEEISNKEPNFKTRVEKLRMALEFAYFEQSKFYGKDPHGMFVNDTKKLPIVRKGLTQRVKNLSDYCTKNGIYELNEGGLSPIAYYNEWLEICANAITHLGEKSTINFLVEPEQEFSGKGSYSLVDGVRGYHDFNINWIGWYGKDAVFELTPTTKTFKTIQLNFLEDQRHWIFLPQTIQVFGLKNNQWELICNESLPKMEENYSITIYKWRSNAHDMSAYSKLKFTIINQSQLPLWRFRKNKKPMLMMDEIELY